MLVEHAKHLRHVVASGLGETMLGVRRNRVTEPDYVDKNCFPAYQL